MVDSAGVRRPKRLSGKSASRSGARECTVRKEIPSALAKRPAMLATRSLVSTTDLRPDKAAKVWRNL